MEGKQSIKLNRYRIRELGLGLDQPIEALPQKIEKLLGLHKGTLLYEEADRNFLHGGTLQSYNDWLNYEIKANEGYWAIIKKSIDARKKNDIHYKLTVDVWLEDGKIKRLPKNVSAVQDNKCKYNTKKEIRNPVVVGFGPAGMFAALELALNGYKPIVIERGANMEKRVSDVKNFMKYGKLDTESNILFGEGGAGTFSDGKLTTGIKNNKIGYVLRTFVNMGAKEEITYKNRPHIGTDIIRKIVVNIRKEIEKHGGKIYFNTRLSDLIIRNQALEKIKIIYNGEENTIETDNLILAIGHSSRDTYELLKQVGIKLEQKPFSIGVRIEHPQKLINEAQFGAGICPEPAEYKLSYKTSSGRGVYSFCMCPGGEVIVCTSENGMLAVNGMSNSKRDGEYANSGILCDVRTSDFESDDSLAGIAFQRKYEKQAFENGGKNFNPPTSTMREFLNGQGDGIKVINSLPEFASNAIREALPEFGKKIFGYVMEDAIVKATETRSSAPLRILRDHNMESNIKGIYPIGEGAGYAGGITSAACDGIKMADILIYGE